MDDKHIIELILDKIEGIQRTSDLIHKDSRESINELKHDMNLRFDNLGKTMLRLTEKVDNEREVNIKQNLRIESVEKQMNLVKDSGDSRLNILEDEQKKISEKVARADVRNKIIWSVASGISATSIGVMIKLIFDKIL